MRGILRRSGAPPGAPGTRVARVHRNTTAAALLLTVAVAGLAGCTTVRQPPVPGPSAPPPPSPPQPEGRSQTPVVQAPAREVLQLIEESHEPEPAAAPTRAAPPPPAAEPDRGRPDRAAPAPHPRPERPGPGARGPQRPRTGAPDLSGPAGREAREQVPGGSDVCALGRRYGGWRADSPEATICRDTYGN